MPREKSIFSTDVESAILNSEIIFLSVNTPTKTFGVGAGRAADLRFVEKCSRTIAEIAQGDKIVVENQRFQFGQQNRSKAF